MKTIILIIALLFGFNTYAMQSHLKTHRVEYKALSNKSDSKVATPKKTKNNNLKRLKIVCAVVVVVFVTLLILLSIAIKKP